VLAGRVGLRPEATALVTELVELLGAAYHDDRNWVVLPTMHPQNCSGDSSVVHEADVVVAVDVQDVNRMVSPAKGPERDAKADPASTLPQVIDLSYAELAVRSWSNSLAAGVDRRVQLVAEPLHGLGQLLARLRGRVDAARAEEMAASARARATQVRARQRKGVERHWDDSPISQARLVAELWTAVRDVDHLLCLRNTRSWPEGWWEFAGAGTFLGGAAGGGIGYGPGALVGGALAARDRGQLGVGIIGDGDLAMAPGALWTARHYRVPLVMVVNNNGSFYNDEPHQAEIARQRGRPEDNSWIGMRVADPGISFVDLATSFGCVGFGPVVDPDDLPGVLAEAVAAARAGETVVVDVRTARG
jgi:acetolactate synthase-1/2/3 large subunit